MDEKTSFSTVPCDPAGDPPAHRGAWLFSVPPVRGGEEDNFRRCVTQVVAPGKPEPGTTDGYLAINNIYIMVIGW